MQKVKNNDTVKVHYTGKLETGEIFDSSIDREPLEFTLGKGMLIKGFEAGVIDMAINEKKTLNIPADEAYGETKDELFQEIKKDMLPAEIKPEVGMALAGRNPDGSETRFVISEVKDDSLVLDANHPLAGKNLVFDIELIEIL